MRSLYGKSSNTNKGIFEVIQDGFGQIFGKLGSFLDEIFPPFIVDGARMLWGLLFGESIGDKEGTRQGGLFSGLYNATKGSLRNAGNWLLSGNTEISEEIPAATGSGLRLGFAGGASGAKQGKKKGRSLGAKAKGAVDKLTNVVNISNKIGKTKDDVVSASQQLIDEAKQSAETGNLKKAMDFLGESVGQLASGIGSFVSAILPDSVKNKTISDEEKKSVAEGVGKLGKEMGLHKGNMGMGALIGAGASLATGAIVGPLAGAAIGAGVGLIASSESVQNMLFGTKDEREQDPDKFNHKVGKWIDDNRKGIGLGAKGAALGTAAGAFLGSPVLGTVIGGAVGFAAGSDKAKKWLFGDEESKGLVPK
jgi:hypothetical protein